MVPPAWEDYLLLPFLKPGKDPADAASYRPIALSSCVLKVFERIWTSRFEWHAEAQGLFDPQQAGFRKGRNCFDVLGTVTGHILRGFAE